MLACERDLSYVDGAVYLLVGSELFEPRIPIRAQAISYEDAGPLACSVLGDLDSCVPYLDRVGSAARGWEGVIEIVYTLTKAAFLLRKAPRSWDK